MISDNLQQVRENIAAAQARGAHAAAQVELIAVTKTKSVEEIAEAIAAGARHLGENRVQELLEKQPLLAADLHWHLIGHLQTNKVKYIVDKVCLIHSLDSLELAQEINRRAAAHFRVMPCLVQVNVADEDSKFGLPVSEVEDFIRQIADLPHLAVCGLMTVGPIVAQQEDIRPVFRTLRELRDQLAARQITGVSMEHLSMGMSGDYQVAVEEGATMVRVGSKIFGQRL